MGPNAERPQGAQLDSVTGAMSEAPGDPGLYGRGRSDGQGANPAPEAFSHRGSLTPPNPTPHRRRKAPTRCARGVSTRCILNERWPNGERRTPRGGRKPAAVPGRGDEAGSEGTRRRVCPGAGGGGVWAEGVGRAPQAEAQRWEGRSVSPRFPQWGGEGSSRHRRPSWPASPEALPLCIPSATRCDPGSTRGRYHPRLRWGHSLAEN